MSKSRKRFGMIYQERNSSPRLDRIDIHVQALRVEAAYTRQRERFGLRSRETSESTACNAGMRLAEVMAC